MRDPIALVYTRVSSEEQAQESLSLQVQRVICERYLEREGWSMEREYQDVMSGSRDQRPSYLAMLVEARRLRSEGRAVVVVVSALDRLGRKVLERVRCREEFKSLGVPIHSVKEGGAVSDLIADVLAAVAQEEVRRLSDRIRTVSQHRIAQGWHPGGGDAPWGYVLRPATLEERVRGAPRSVLDTNPVTAPYVHAMFERVAQSDTTADVVRWIATLPEEARGGRILSYTSVHERLRSPLYVARSWKGDADILARPAMQWPPLVEDELWSRVQHHFASSVRRATGRYLLSGFLRCPRCGTRAAGARILGHPRFSYVCGSHACTGYLGTGTLDALVLTEVQAVVQPLTIRKRDTQRALARLWNELQGPNLNATSERKTDELRAKMTQSHRRLASATTLHMNGDLDHIGFERVQSRVRSDLDDAQARLATLESATITLPSMKWLRRRVSEWSATLAGENIPAQRWVLDALIDHMYAVRRGHGRYEVRITWSPLGNALVTAWQRLETA